MKKLLYKSSLLALAAGMVLTSCDPEIDVTSPSSGTANFSSYIAVGNSLSAGYQDNGLYREGQLKSFPSIIANQLKAVGGGDFVQPLFSEAQANGSGYMKLGGFTAQGSPIFLSVTDKLALRSQSPVLYTKATENVNNLAIPGIKVADIKTQGYGSTQGNPYFERLTVDPMQTYLDFVKQQVQAKKATFFTNWMAENDVLAYATAGGFDNTLTDISTFTNNYTELVNALTANGAKGVLITIPDVTAIPFFTTVGPTVKQTLTASGVSGMVALTGKGNSRTQFTTAQINAPENGVLFTLTGSSYAPLLGTKTGKYWRDLAKQVSKNNPDPLVVKATLAQLLTTYSVDTTKFFGFTNENPWPSALLLDVAEQTDILNSINAFNNHIKSQANAKGLALFDAFTYFRSTRNGFIQNGVAYSPAFISGNLFSLDGVHPTPRGYAILANEVIKTINAKYNANVPLEDVTKYRAVLLP
jgi:hypothetical protein